MRSTASLPVTNRVPCLLRDFTVRGVKIWLDDGSLRFRAPKGALTTEDLERLRASKDDIISALHAMTGKEARNVHGYRYFAPLSFTQLAHWKLHNLKESPSLMQIATAMYIRGALNIEALKKSVDFLIQRHEALRTDMVLVDDIPLQMVSGAGYCPINIEDLSELPLDSRNLELMRRIERIVSRPVSVLAEQLFAIWLFELNECENVLLIAMEHSISDEVSKRIFLRELLVAHEQISHGYACVLPSVPTQFSDHAFSLAANLGPWREEHAAYWTERLSQFDHVRFPEDTDASGDRLTEWGCVQFKVGGRQKQNLTAWCQRRGITTVVGALAVFVATVLRWTSSREIIIQYVTDGRPNPTLANTIGYFGSTLYLRVGYLSGYTLVDLIDRILQELYLAYEHADYSYLASVTPASNLMRNVMFNWLPFEIEPGESHPEASKGALEFRPLHLRPAVNAKLDPERDPGMLLHDASDAILGYVYFPRERFSDAYIYRFVENFHTLMDVLLQAADQRIDDIVLNDSVGRPQSA